MDTLHDPDGLHFELRFQSLFDDGRGYAFDCDADGHVDLDALSEQARVNYFYARAVVGREVTMPAVRAVALPTGRFVAG